jgi:hypothetical protein
MSALTSTVSSVMTPGALADHGLAAQTPVAAQVVRGTLSALGIIAVGNTIAQDKSHYQTQGSTLSANAQVRPAQSKVNPTVSLSTGPTMQGEGT